MSEEMKKGKKKKVSFFEKVADKLKTSKKLRISVLVAAVVLVAFFGLSIYANSSDDIYPGISVNGVDVGGMSLEEATAEITEKIVNPVANRNITFKCGENEKTVSAIELTPDGIDAAVIAKQAYDGGRSDGWFANTFAFVGALMGNTDIKAEIDLDNELLKAVVDEISASYAEDVRETGYSIEGNTLTIIRGKGGRLVDMGKAIEKTRAALADVKISEVVLEVEEAQPKDVNVDELYAEITKPAQDAYYKKENGQLVIVDAVDGVVIDKAEVEKALKSGKEEFDIKVSFTKASKTAADLNKNLFRDVMGEWSSSYSTSSAARATNVELTSDRINGYILLPGEVFSYDKTVGSRTLANGYKSAGVYVGNKVESGIGGGICQTSSTLYGAVLYSNLEIVERTSHSLPVAYVPKGQDATIAEGYIDFRFKNNTEYPVKIISTYSNRKLVCKIVGVKTEGQSVEVVHTVTGTLYPKLDRKTDESIPQGYKKTVVKGAPGYTIASKRIVKADGKVIKEEKLVSSRYNATNTEELVNPSDMNAPSESLKEYTGKEEEDKTDEEKPETEATAPDTSAGATEETPVTPEAPKPETQPEETVTEPVAPSEPIETVPEEVPSEDNEEASMNEINAEVSIVDEG